MQKDTIKWYLPSESEVRELAKRALASQNKIFLIQNDLATLQSKAQALVNQNNQAAERSLQSSYDEESTLVEYAAIEQNISDTYNFLLLCYEGSLQSAIEKSAYKLSFYFDNYFVDFESNLQEAKKDTNMRASQHPYFVKMYRTTQDKLSTLYKIYLDNTKVFKEKYIQDQSFLMQIRDEKKRYIIAYETVLDEFVTYAGTFYEALDAPQQEQEELEKKITTLQARYSI